MWWSCPRPFARREGFISVRRGGVGPQRRVPTLTVYPAGDLSQKGLTVNVDKSLLRPADALFGEHVEQARRLRDAHLAQQLPPERTPTVEVGLLARVAA